MDCLWRMGSWSQMIRVTAADGRKTNMPYRFLYGLVPEAMPTSHLLGLNVRSRIQQSILLPPYRLPQHVSPPRPGRRKLRETSSRYGGLHHWGQTPSSPSPHGWCTAPKHFGYTAECRGYDSLQWSVRVSFALCNVWYIDSGTTERTLGFLASS